MAAVQGWTDVLDLRPEVLASDGGVGELQMSLHKAVYQTVDVPYRDVGYYADITQPTPNLIGFFSRIARRLSDAGEATALYHLDQGMGGGKSHALVGLYHMAVSPAAFFDTDLGRQVKAEADAGGKPVDINAARVVTLTADHFSPGKPTELFGPAVDLFERFLWSLFDGNRAAYDGHVAMGANKSTLQKALASVGRPVLVLLDELMDYAMELSNAGTVDTMPGEQGFLNALMDACDDVPGVAFIVVMIRSELDPEGYTPLADSFREYVARRLNRNGTNVAVTETGDFAAIIRRRLFTQTGAKLPTAKLAADYLAAVEKDAAWGTQVLDRLGAGKSGATLAVRIADSYPFHPDLMDLVENEWGKAQGFQRVRSTVAIFAIAALHWSRAAKAGEWSPPLIGVGDLPLGGVKGTGSVAQARGLDALLNSGLLLGNDRAIQGYRAVASTDVTSADGESGQAVEIDRRLREPRIDRGQPNPAVRMATALFVYSLISRGQGRRGATKAELLASLMLPASWGACGFAAVEEVFLAVTGSDGLGALEVNKPANDAERFWLTINQTLRMFFNSARSQVGDADAHGLMWEAAQKLAHKGQFDEIIFVDQPSAGQSLREAVAGIDSQLTRLVVLDPRHWSLLNGDDSKSRTDIRRIFGIGSDAIGIDNAASCVVASVNTYQRKYAVQAAQEVLTWRLVAGQVVEDTDRADVQRNLGAAEGKLKEKVRSAFRHYAYLMRKGEQLEVVFCRFDDDKHTSLDGNNVWGSLVAADRAVGQYMDPVEKRQKRKTLSETFVALLIDGFDRHLTPRDVVTSFYKDPRFPLVPNPDEIRQVLFDLLQPAGHAGQGTGGWELIEDGARLRFDGPKQLAISSVRQQLRRTEAPEATARPGSKTETVSDGPSGGGGEKASVVAPKMPGEDGGGSSPDGTKTKADSYSWYRVEVTNRSITGEPRREALHAHLFWLASLLDRNEIDPQLFTLKYELLAATDPELANDVRQRGELVEAGKVDIEEDI